MYTSCILFWILHPTIPSWMRYPKENVISSGQIETKKNVGLIHTIYIKVLVTLICENVEKSIITVIL